MEHFYDNSLQTGLMRDLAIDLEVLGEHVVLLGNQVIKPRHCKHFYADILVGCRQEQDRGSTMPGMQVQISRSRTSNTSFSSCEGRKNTFNSIEILP